MKAIRGGLNGAIKIETLNPFVLRLNLWDFESGNSVQCLLKKDALEYWDTVKSKKLRATIVYGDYNSDGVFIASAYSFGSKNPFFIRYRSRLNPIQPTVSSIV
ncbi:hypothetical protein [Levilactobacillus brevis]|uniref:hypothetical protein n=1 Tax=Levilactobacillus brevis TaxID=1580 RepID=UPI000580229B|nr:hypothetical protein [Levilactobacillus brevis]